jgi:hypothetical protein
MEASQASDMGSIPIARSINLVDSVALPLLKLKNGADWPEFWTQLGPNFFSNQRLSSSIFRSDFGVGTFAARF